MSKRAGFSAAIAAALGFVSMAEQAALRAPPQPRTAPGGAAKAQLTMAAEPLFIAPSGGAMPRRGCDAAASLQSSTPWGFLVPHIRQGRWGMKTNLEGLGT